MASSDSPIVGPVLLEKFQHFKMNLFLVVQEGRIEISPFEDSESSQDK